MSEAARRKKFTLPQVRQQQLAWNLYISEGIAANLRHALQTNSFCLLRADVASMRRQVREAEKFAKHWRAQLNEPSIPKEIL